MKVNNYIWFLLLFPGFLLHQNTAAQKSAEAQNIRGDTLYLDTKNSVAIVFPSALNRADMPDSDGSYEANGDKNSLLITAKKNGAKDQTLEVLEGSRNHLFILSYKEGSPARRIDVSTKKKQEAYAGQIRKNVLKALPEADDLYKKALNNSSDQTAWEKVEEKYQQLERVVDSKNAGIVKSRLEECRKEIARIKGKKYNEAIRKGQDYYTSKNYKEAKKANKEALELRPGDELALKNIRFIDSMWLKDYVDKGDEAYKAKKYIDAKRYYKEALTIKPDDPLLQNKFSLAKKEADPLIYKIEKERGDLALNANDIKEARRAYDSALAVRPDDAYIKKQLKKVVVEEEKIAQEEKNEAIYQGILANAKNLAGAASNAREYELAIKEYKRASDMMPTRKFPKKKMAELAKIKSSVAAN